MLLSTWGKRIVTTITIQETILNVIILHSFTLPDFKRKHQLPKKKGDEAYKIVRKAIVQMRMFENLFKKKRMFEIKDAIVRMLRIIACSCCNLSK